MSKPTANPSRRAVLITGLTLFLAGLVYPTIVAEALTGWSLPVAHSYLSEYSALTMPFGLWFRILDATAGTLAIISAVGLLRLATAQGWGGLHRSAAWLILVFGAGTICDAILPLDCAVVEPQCAELERVGALSVEHKVHVVTSSVASGAAMACTAVLAVLWRWGRDPRPSVPCAILAGIAFVANAWFLVAFVALGQVAGIAQRVNVTAFSLVLMVLGIQVLRARSRCR